MLTPTKALEIAEEFRWLAANESADEPEHLSPLRLQKLLYYAQGWALAEHGQPLFADRIEAWKLGPVVYDVFKRFESHGKSPITTDQAVARPNLNPREREIVLAVWNAYKRYSALALSEMTHDDPAFLDAYRPDSAGRCSNEIPKAAIQESFRKQLDAMQRRLSLRRSLLIDRAAKNTQRLTGRRAV